MRIKQFVTLAALVALIVAPTTWFASYKAATDFYGSQARAAAGTNAIGTGAYTIVGPATSLPATADPGAGICPDATNTLLGRCATDLETYTNGNSSPLAFTGTNPITILSTCATVASDCYVLNTATTMSGAALILHIENNGVDSLKVTAGGNLTSSGDITANTSNIVVGKHLNQSATGKTGGHCAVSSTVSCTFSVGNSFVSTPLIACFDENTSQILQCQGSISTTTVTLALLPLVQSGNCSATSGACGAVTFGTPYQATPNCTVTSAAGTGATGTPSWSALSATGITPVDGTTGTPTLHWHCQGLPDPTTSHTLGAIIMGDPN